MPDFRGEIGEYDSFNYGSCKWRGFSKYSCLECPYYLFHNEAAMLKHCRQTGHGIVKNGLMTPDIFIKQKNPERLPSVTITLGYLCWNTEIPSSEGAVALYEEAKRVASLGAKCNIVILDNGSSDDTYWKVREALPYYEDEIVILRNDSNYGISRGRNRIIDVARGYGSDFLMLMDGDIEIVPLSAYQMTRYLLCHAEVGCIGASSSNYTQDRARTTKGLYEIVPSRVKDDIKVAWTQYGMFRMSMIEKGIRFDEEGPFKEPGWGFEDDDLALQMLKAGWENRYFGGMTYLHRNIRSSWPNLKESGVDVPSMFKKRQQYLLDKWNGRGIPQGILRAVSNQHPPK